MSRVTLLIGNARETERSDRDCSISAANPSTVGRSKIERSGSSTPNVCTTRPITFAASSE